MVFRSQTWVRYARVRITSTIWYNFDNWAWWILILYYIVCLSLYFSLLLSRNFELGFFYYLNFSNFVFHFYLKFEILNLDVASLSCNSYIHNNNFLHFNLHNSIDWFNHSRRIMLLIECNLFARELIPTLVLLFFMNLKVVWHEVKTWLKFSDTNSTGLKSRLYILNRQSTN